MVLPPLSCETGFVLETLKLIFPAWTVVWSMRTELPLPTTVMRCPAAPCSLADASQPTPAAPRPP